LAAVGDSSGPSRRHPVTIELQGRYGLAEVPSLWRTLQSATLRLRAGDQVRVDLSRVDQLDGAAVGVLDHARRELERRGVAFDLASASPNLQELIRSHASAEDVGRGPPEDEGKGLLWHAGRDTIELAREMGLSMVFVGRLARSLPRALRLPASVNWRMVPSLVEHAGADAVPIIALVQFLVGTVTAYEASLQLKRFGATIYIADLVGASIVREFGPLITAVIVTGRTGAAFAAELGTMSVSEEVNALRVLGIDPLRFLVLPRMLALAAVVPFLTLLGDFMGILGGMLIAAFALGITPPEYMSETRSVVFASDIFWGVVKSFAFSLAIGAIACQQGLAASGGASGVGRRTTSAVVSTLVAIICIDSLFAPFVQGRYR
jgi:phospholipid/cholesterol/gamma-HCH transport system permease protein